jgi:hypothetical protein
MNRYYSLLVLSCLVQLASAQINIEGQVVDARTKEPLPFATVLNLKGYGNTTDLDGKFSLQLRLGDTIRISYVGYESKRVIVQKAEYLNLSLNPVATQLKTVEIIAENDFLYDFLAKTRYSLSQEEKQAKCYFNLISRLNDQPTEINETYYNGTFLGYNLKKLELKNGRIGLMPYQDQYFLNKSTSEALLMHQLIEQAEYFPLQPIGLNKRKLKKHFSLSFNNRYHQESGEHIYVIDFQSKDHKEEGFNGTVWVDSSASSVVKIQLRKKKAHTHPFLPLFENSGEIECADMFLRKEFVKLGKWYFLKTLDFQYELDFINQLGEEQKIKSQALLAAYDYQSAFFLPKFNFPDGLRDDYRKISALPYQQRFWANSKRFKLIQTDSLIKTFYSNPLCISARNANFLSTGRSRSLYEHPYSIWNGQRILMKSEANAETAGLPQSSLYQLEVQLYLDVYERDGKTYTETAAIFDPFESYYLGKQDSVSAVFINIYFDLAEIYRRKLAVKLAKIESEQEAQILLDEILTLYNETLQEFKQTAKLYFSEVKMGKDIEALKAWNREVILELGIDNIALFWNK